MASNLRIGELARRTGVNPALLRAWERRYGLIEPERTSGGFRLYSERDERRVRAMVENIAGGLAAAEAARLARDDTGETATVATAPGPEPGLLAALLAFEETAAHAALDRLLAEYSRETVLVEHVLPVLHDLGDGWAGGEVSVAQEHFASGLLRGRLLGLARGWDRGAGPRAILGCPPGELHDLGLIAFGLLLRELGWRITMVGADTPLETLRSAAAALRPEAVVLAATSEERFVDAASEIGELTAVATVAIGGSGATETAAARTGVRALSLDPVRAAAQLSRL
jgi:DNA-binding transcriptional MerR regulator